MHALHYIFSVIVYILCSYVCACSCVVLLSPLLQVYEEPNHSKIFTVSMNVFSLGESTYNLTDAQVLRVKLLKRAESIDSLR
jgi:hypothetical protein